MTEAARGASNLLRAKSWRSRSPKNQPSNRRSPLAARQVAVLLLLLLLGLTGGAGFVSSSAAGKIALGVTVNGLELGGLSPDETRAILREQARNYRLNFRLEDSFDVSVAPFAQGRLDGTKLADFGVEEAVRLAYAIGHGDNWLQATQEKIVAYLFGTDLVLNPNLKADSLAEEVENKYGGLSRLAEDARLEVWKNRATGDYVVSVLPAREGAVLNRESLARQAEDRLAALSITPIVLRLVRDRPKLAFEDIEPLKAEVMPALARAPLTVTAKERSWTVTTALVTDWLIARPTGDERLPAQLGLDVAKVTAFLAERTAPLAVEPQDAVFEITDGRVTKIEPSVDGEEPDLEAAVAAIENRLFRPNSLTEAADGPVEIPFRIVPPQVDTASANPWGIKEIIGIGTSNFRGSPANRRSNIKTGAASLNGLVIQPDEEFSLLKALGEISDKTGYLKELVIKKDKTTPEFGGGLCQIGTTTFRAVLDAGLPILERRNHSYRVSYYERDGDGKLMGPGKDATIYEPWPDFKFKNDTGRAVVLMTAVEGNKVTFTLWGVRDGREAEQSAVRVWNEKPPPEKKVIETTELKPGETKCTESPHPGADAMFTYTVNYPDGRVEKKDFYSHYVPWGEVCLVGVDPAALPAAGAAPPNAAAGATGGVQMP